MSVTCQYTVETFSYALGALGAEVLNGFQVLEQSLSPESDHIADLGE